MKRGFHHVSTRQEGASTPLHAKPPLNKKAGVKKQKTIRAFLTVETPHAGATPAPNGTGEVGTSGKPGEWPSTCQRAFEKFGIDTPSGLHPDQDIKLARQQSAFQRAGSCLDAELDDFRVFSSQTYTYIRRSSQTTHTDDEREDDTEGTPAWKDPYTSFDTQAPTQLLPTQLLPTQAMSEHFTQQGDVMSTQVLDHGDSLESTSNVHGLTPIAQTQVLSSAHMVDLSAGIDMGAHAATPELAPVAHTSGMPCDKPGSVGDKPAKLFDIFRPKTQRKYLVVVRHGESEYNKAVQESKSYADPMIFDPHLTQKGLMQCKELKKSLGALLRDKAKEFGDPLFVVSPLTRALQTFLESCPWPERMPGGQDDGAGGSGGASTSAPPQPPLRVEVCPAISEFVITAGDVGRPPSALAQEFPQLAEQLSRLPEEWWFHKDGKPNCALTKHWGGAEPKDHQAKRVSEFTRWLGSRTERLVVLIGHSAFWHAFSGKQKRLANCEFYHQPW
uniref:Phosphoglycerate mutase-like protein n=1 Tax=Chlamydomonas leiostraca TaxID=1034604 RepID=A0A7S0WR48_9CHLO|mmetsp:Transcript_23553/g.60185  ORF Transcript_23553/g.60185 Transcript_23553/m.60185 type:complete len:501 (+) Transcript_23553:104-1606(+)